MKSLKDILGHFENNSQFKKPLRNIKLQDLWIEVVGTYIAKQTKKVYIHENKLFVYMPISVIKNELRLSKENILKKINEHYNEEVVKELVLY